MRNSEVFDLFNFTFYIGPNPFLNARAVAFDFAPIDENTPLSIESYVESVSDRYPHISEGTYESYADLFARTLSEVAKLDIDLHVNRCSVKTLDGTTKIALQSLHDRTTIEIIYFVWDWFEAITQSEDFRFDRQMRRLQHQFGRSVYGGPTVYTLLRTAGNKGIPAFYLWEEGLMQYGYGKNQVRGVATTFDCDSHLDSDFSTRKDDCKAFLGTLGFPVPKGDIVISAKEALDAAQEIGYPVAVKPVSGHKGIGVTAEVQNADELEIAFERAIKAIPENERIRVIVEKSISGSDFRLLCVNGRFVAATERRPAWVVGDGYSTIEELIERENRQPSRLDSPTSPLSKIQGDEAMEDYLKEQNLSINSIIEAEQTVYLRKVANLSSGGVSIDATPTIHPDNIILAQDIAQHFRLTCLGIDVITPSLVDSWKSGNFAILEINAAPGIFMHLNPATGESVDVPAHILETFFESETSARIPIITFNKISVRELQETIDRILEQHPDWTIGAVCRQGVFVNRSEKVLNKSYNSNVQSLLRNPRLDLLITEYDEEILEAEGMFYYGSNLVVLDNPSEIEMMLVRDVFETSTTVIKERDSISIRRKGLLEQYTLEPGEPLTRVYLKEIGTIHQ